MCCAVWMSVFLVLKFGSFFSIFLNKISLKTFLQNMFAFFYYVFPFSRSRSVRRSKKSCCRLKRDSSADTSKDIDDIEDFELDEGGRNHYFTIIFWLKINLHITECPIKHDCVFLIPWKKWLVQCTRVQKHTLDKSLFTRYQKNTAMFNWSPFFKIR